MSFKKLKYGICISQLDSGVNVITKKIPGQLVKMCHLVRGGSIYDPPDQIGLSHLMEHCVFDGVKEEAITEQMPLYCDHDIALMAEGVGSYINAFTDCPSIGYKLDCHKSDFKKMAEVLLRFSMFPRLADDSVQYQRRVVCAEICQEIENPSNGDSSEGWYFNAMLRGQIFKRNPIRNNTVGIEKHVLKIKPEAVRERFANFHAPNNMAFIVLSPFDHKDVVRMVASLEKKFGHLMPPQLKEIPRIDPSLLVEPRQRRNVRVVDPPGKFKHVFEFMGYRATSVYNKDRVPIQILSAVMGGFSFSRLYKTFREEWGKAYETGTYTAGSHTYSSTIHGEMVLYADFFSERRSGYPEIVDRSVEFIVKQLKAIKRGEISSEELNNVQTALYSNYRKVGVNDPDTMQGWIENGFASNDFYSEESIEESIMSELDNIADINLCSRRKFLAGINRQIEPDRYSLLVAGPPGCYSK